MLRLGCIIRWVFVLFILLTHYCPAEEATVLRNSNLRQKPTTASPSIVLVTANQTVTILSPRPNQGYYRAKTRDGKTGWLWSKNLRSSGAVAGGESDANFTQRAGPAALYPNAGLTPGSTDTRVTQSNIKSTICVSNYTGCTAGGMMGTNKDKKCPYEVRPPVYVTNKIKAVVIEKYGFKGSMADYELDHLISLQLGGCPDCEDNLWPEAYTPVPGARQKDVVENYLKRQVCNGKMTLAEAQKQIAEDWYAVYVQTYGEKTAPNK